MKRKSTTKSTSKSTPSKTKAVPKPKLKLKPNIACSPIGQEPFEFEYRIIDAAITSALIAGIDADVLDTCITLKFLTTAADLREIDDKQLSKWLTEPDYIWSKIVQCLHDLFENIEEQTIHQGFEELEHLRSHLNLKSTELEQLEFFRHTKKAEEIINYLYITFALDGTSSPYSFEKSLLLAWIKVSVLQDHIPEEVYIIARQHMPKLFDLYSEVMSKH